MDGGQKRKGQMNCKTGQGDRKRGKEPGEERGESVRIKEVKRQQRRIRDQR